MYTWLESTGHYSKVKCKFCYNSSRADRYEIEKHLVSSKRAKKSGKIDILLDKLDFQQAILQIKLSVLAAVEFLACLFFDHIIPY